MPTQCQQCGATNRDAANFCGRCGAFVSPRGARSTTPDFPLLRQWRRLKVRMTRKEVRAILGEPAKIEAPGVVRANETSQPDSAPMERWLFEYVAEQANRTTLASATECASSAPSRPLLGIVEFAPPDGTVSKWIEPDWTLFA